MGEGDGSPPPVFTGAGSRREDNGRGVFTRAGSSREERRGEFEGEGRREWPKRDGRPLGSPLRGEGGRRARRRRDSSTSLRYARNDMWGSAGRNEVWGRGMGPRIREDNGRGVFTRAGYMREERRGELEGEGRREWPKRDGRPLGSPLRGEGGRRARGRRDFSAPLRCARNDMWGSAGRNDMWGKGMGPRIREDNGRGVFTRAGFSREERRGELEGEGRREWPKRDGRPLGSPLRGEGGMAEPGNEIPRLRCCARNDMWGKGMGPRIREDNGRGDEGRLFAGRTEGRA